VAAIVAAATFNLSQFPGFRGTTYYAEFSDASGIHKGNVVQVGGIRVGRVTDVALSDDATVVVKFEVDGGVEFGPDSQASIEVYNLLGEKYLDLTPAGEGQLEAGEVIPVERTQSAYDIVGVFGDLTETTEQINTDNLSEALDVVAETVDGAAPEFKASIKGITRISKSISSRDEEIQTLLVNTERVGKVLSARSDDLVELMDKADLVFKELQKRKRAVHDLLVNARSLAKELRGVATDNQKQIGPALKEVEDLTDFLLSRKEELNEVLEVLGPYAATLGNILGSGPWFDAYAANLLGVATGEFLPGPQEFE
jgi:phospholipid/cholesterol/gamma-HCH transport system substrate-binding protein